MNAQEQIKKLVTALIFKQAEAEIIVRKWASLGGFEALGDVEDCYMGWFEYPAEAQGHFEAEVQTGDFKYELLVAGKDYFIKKVK
jgi:hypothetical protein